MSHELRTPLNAIIGYTEMAREDLVDIAPKQVDSDLAKVLTAAQHLLSLIQDVLDLSKVEADKMVLELSACDLEALVRQAADTVMPMAARKGNRLTVEIAGPLGVAEVDASKLRQSLLNLLSNACKFTSQGEVTLRVQARADNTLHISVQDTGTGIPASKLDTLFEPFVRAHDQVIEGTGLGLALTRRFCRLMGGDVSVESVEGQGSCFTIKVPITRMAPAQASCLVAEVA
jgi:signal transduction histidine kinase